MSVRLDDDAVERAVAAVEVLGRSGARNVEFGYLHDDQPVGFDGCLWTRRGDQWVRSCDGKGAQRTARR